ncbi:MAG: winged helix-turn-helix transcriptional regulator, partial [Thermoleophilia bacterium]|nr:winged helix-turn-helix transcriptional regulator [Thermoleophilia bacterium]
DILEHVWDGEAEHSSNVINVYIKDLRNQLDRPFGTHTIETIRGVGYRLATTEDAWRTQPSHDD